MYHPQAPAPTQPSHRSHRGNPQVPPAAQKGVPPQLSKHDQVLAMIHRARSARPDKKSPVYFCKPKTRVGSEASRSLYELERTDRVAEPVDPAAAFSAMSLGGPSAPGPDPRGGRSHHPPSNALPPAAAPPPKSHSSRSGAAREAVPLPRGSSSSKTPRS